MADATLPWVERFWEKVEIRGPDECWPWLASVERFGYGRCKGPNDRPDRSHRVSYEIANGPIPKGAFVRHVCDNPRCVNPTHLVLGTVQDNNQDRHERGRYRPLLPRLAAKPGRKFKSGPPITPVESRLLASIVKDEISGCWIWQRAKQATGHAVMTLPPSNGSPRRVVKAYRMAYELWVGPIPPGLFILHSCDNGACINPDHLRIGTHSDNMKDMAQRGRAASGFRNGNVANPLRGEKIGLSKLTEKAVRQIRAGMSTKKAMDKFGVSKATVCKARTGSCWRHVH